MEFKAIGNFKTLSWFTKPIWLYDGLMVFCLTLFLTCFLFLREVKLDHLELGGVAKNYLLSQKGFEFPDTEATRLLREESVRDLGKIYLIPHKEITKIEYHIQETLVNNPEWRQELPTVTFDELLEASAHLRDVLVRLRFTDARTIAKLDQIDHAFDGDLIYRQWVPKEKSQKLPYDIWRQIEQKTFANETLAARFILEQYMQHGVGLQEDFSLQHHLSQTIKDSIPLKMTQVQPGARIINAGAKVSIRHLDMMKGMKQTLLQDQRKVTPVTLLGAFGVSLLFTLCGIFYLRASFPYVLSTPSKKGLIVALVILTLALSKIGEHLIVCQGGNFEALSRFLILLPTLTLLLTILIDKKVAMVVSIFTLFALSLILNCQTPAFLMLNIAAAVVATGLVKRVRKRKEILVMAAKLWLMLIPFSLAFYLLEGSPLSFWTALSITFISIVASAVLVIVLLPLLESIFGIVTDMTLFELGDLTHPLLRRLNLEAPGTYRHSLAVAALAEEAALAINASPVFCRVASLFHDIGKVAQPQYYLENRFSIPDLHCLLTPLESAELIISHVTLGMKLAKENGLPPSIIDVIAQHHGTGLVYYFYHEEMKRCRMKGAALDVEKFRYPGPRPTTREAAIVMLADSVEAAFRSLEHVTESATAELVESVVGEKIRDHQLDHSHLTFDEIEAIKKIFIKSLMAASHTRVKYPAVESAAIWKREEVVVRFN
jgi:putative nucleotidyltransferase with HDIG domain